MNKKTAPIATIETAEEGGFIPRSTCSCGETVEGTDCSELIKSIEGHLCPPS